jgi:hypothetical protein
MEKDKEKLKQKINNKVNELIDGVELIGNINFFSIYIKCVNGDLVIELRNTYKVKCE